MLKKVGFRIILKLLLIGMLTLLSFNGIVANATGVEPAAWWDFNWEHRVPIKVMENSGNMLTDYQVCVKVDTASLIGAGKMQADGSDIRFTDSANNEIPYWIESEMNIENTTIWVTVPQIPAFGTETIYMYYGNPTAISVSNADAVFDFFDDFAGTTINGSKWTTVGTYFAQDEVLKTTGGPGAADTDGIYSVNNYTRPFVLEWKERVVGYGALYTSSEWGTRLAGVAFADSKDYWYMYNSTAWPRELACCENGVTRWSQTYFWTLETWYDFKLIIKSAGITAFVDGVQKWDGTNGTTSPLYIGTAHYDGQYEWDNVRVRKYAFPEPTYLVWSEETFTDFSVLWEEETYHVTTVSNSTITEFNFSQPMMQVVFNVSGSSGTVGYCNVTIPKALLKGEPWTVIINGINSTFTPSGNATHSFIYFTYTHASTLQVIIRGTWVVPEFQPIMILPIFVALTMLAVLLVKRRTARKNKI